MNSLPPFLNIASEMKSLEKDLEFRLPLLEVFPGGEVRLSCLEVSSVLPVRLHLPLVGKICHLN